MSQGKSMFLHLHGIRGARKPRRVCDIQHQIPAPAQNTTRLSDHHSQEVISPLSVSRVPIEALCSLGAVSLQVEVRRTGEDQGNTASFQRRQKVFRTRLVHFRSAGRYLRERGDHPLEPGYWPSRGIDTHIVTVQRHRSEQSTAKAGTKIQDLRIRSRKAVNNGLSRRWPEIGDANSVVDSHKTADALSIPASPIWPEVKSLHQYPSQYGVVFESLHGGGSVGPHVPHLRMERIGDPQSNHRRQ